MPKTKFQGIIFGLLMSYSMAYGMEIYNIAIKEGYLAMNGGFSNLTNQIFLDVAIEASYMGLFVFLFSNLWGNRLGEKFANKHMNPTKDNPYLYRLFRQACTVGIMCPTMSLVASILFNVILAGQSITQLPAIWVGTVLKNFPMAFLWNMYAASPFSHAVFHLIFEHRNKTQDKITEKT
ncbi:MAG: hypothetical protein LUF89_06320 [Ruminococcus sp.]|nr:hypothetical protein [Ruminococcus sp.]